MESRLSTADARSLPPEILVHVHRCAVSHIAAIGGPIFVTGYHCVGTDAADGLQWRQGVMMHDEAPAFVDGHSPKCVWRFVAREADLAPFEVTELLVAAFGVMQVRTWVVPAKFVNRALVAAN